MLDTVGSQPQGLQKPATTSVTIHDIIARRWSPRAYDPNKTVSKELLASLLEAARWAPSCFGAEPWRYIVCDKATDQAAWDKAFSCLAEGNQGWAQDAQILLLATCLDNFEYNSQPNRWASYDTGAASENLCLQATASGLVAHQMGGFDPNKAREVFNIPDSITSMAMIAIGYQADTSTLEGEMREREEAPRKRKPLDTVCFAGAWGEGWK